MPCSVVSDLGLHFLHRATEWLPKTMDFYSIYSKYLDTLTPYHTYHKIWTSPPFYLIWHFMQIDSTEQTIYRNSFSYFCQKSGFDISWRQIAWSFRSYFLRKIRKKYNQFVIYIYIYVGDKKSFHFWSNWKFTGCQVPHFMIVFIPYISLLNLSWLIKCLFCLSKFVLDKILITFHQFSKKMRLGILCKSSARQIVHLKYQALLSPLPTPQKNK